MISNESIMFDDQIRSNFRFQRLNRDKKLNMGGMDKERDFEMQILDNNKFKQPADKKHVLQDRSPHQTSKYPISSPTKSKQATKPFNKATYTLPVDSDADNKSIHRSQASGCTSSSLVSPPVSPSGRTRNYFLYEDNPKNPSTIVPAKVKKSKARQSNPDNAEENPADNDKIINKLSKKQQKLRKQMQEYLRIREEQGKRVDPSD